MTPPNHKLALPFALCLCLASGLQAQPRALPGLSSEKRPLSRREIETSQLPPKARWQQIRASVPSSLNGLLLPEPDGSWAFYARNPRTDSWVTVVRDNDLACASTEGEVLNVDLHQAPLAGAPRVAWRFYRRGMTIDVGGIKLFDLPDCDGWEFFWIDTKAPPQETKIFPVDLEDGFMRTRFGGADRWESPNQSWQLKQYGGGMPTTEAEAKSANYRRAANAFTIVGSQGEARTGRDDWVNYLAEARFFFGRPDSFARRDTLVRTILGGEPVYRDATAIYRSNQIHEFPDASFFIAQGAPGEYRIAFGWNASERRYELRYLFPKQAEWQTLRHWQRRPYFTNWVRLGIAVTRGNHAMPFIDGDQLGAYELPFVVSGPLAVISEGKGKAEADDVVAVSYPRPSRLGTPVFAQSTNFAEKELLEKKDVQTGQWTRSELTFEDDDTKLRARNYSLSRCRFPLYGDFTYRPDPKLPAGDYCLALVSERDRPYATVFLNKSRSGWETPNGTREFSLEIGRRRGHLLRRIDGRWQPITLRQVSSTVYLVVGAVEEKGLVPEMHHIYSRSLTQDLFEKAPSEWAWHEGNFRMDVRWQCQRGWNFMMGKSLDVATMFSKTYYGGDQEIEFYNALRFVTPPPYYVLRDLGFAFCTDGRNLGSGYVLIYGDGDSGNTTLLRNGKPVEQVARVIRNKPGGNIHNYWWHGRVRKQGREITVEIDDEEVLTFRDPNPLPGGHVAFWTCRNAFSIAKVAINAEEQEPRPQLFQIRPESGGDTPWMACNPDEVEVRRLGSGRCRATSRSGGGTFAVRWQAPEAGIDLQTRPHVSLDVRYDRDVKVGIHLEVSGHSFYYPFTSGDEGIRGLLTPEYEARPPAELYRANVLDQAALEPLLVPGRYSSTAVHLDFRAIARKLPEAKLTSITIGNACNANYRLLGTDGNPPDSSYTVGEPEFAR